MGLFGETPVFFEEDDLRRKTYLTALPVEVVEPPQADDADQPAEAEHSYDGA